jgi:DNA-directed RNA polymerase specialized sigma24 family protein
MATSPHEITQLLHAWSNREQSAPNQLMPLVNEAYVRLVDSKQAIWARGAVAAGAQTWRESHDDGAGRSHCGARENAVDLIAPDHALDALAAFDARKSQVVELRIFGALKAEETAEVLKISTDTVTRDMHMATARLRRELGREGRRGL